MDRDDVYRELQSRFCTGSLLVVGSGIAAKYGVPGMPALGRHLVAEMPSALHAAAVDATTWKKVAEDLNRHVSLERAMDALGPYDPMLPLLAKVTADFISKGESVALTQIAAGSDAVALQRLLQYFSRTSTAPLVITTNYDRLVEICCERARVAVDSGFYGQYAAWYDEVDSVQSVVEPSRIRKGAQGYRNHIKLAKPHGSLDWFLVNGEPMRLSFAVDAERLMITPGESKFAQGHKPPFDAHMQRASRGVDEATSIIFLGYGFADPHLQTHLPRRFSQKVPAVILTLELSADAHIMLERFPHILGVEATSSRAGSRIYRDGKVIELRDASLWDIDFLMNEVLL